MAITHRDGSITHTGRVISLSTHWNSSMDVDTYQAHVWNDETGRVDVVSYGSNWDADSNHRGAAVVDITEESAPAYFAMMQAAEIRRAAEDEAREFNRLERGKSIEVVKGRKLARGTRGIIFWIGNNGWGESVGFKTAAGDKHFTASSNVAVVA